MRQPAQHKCDASYTHHTTPTYALAASHQVWPHNQLHKGLWNLWTTEERKTPHDKFVFSGGFWVAEAIRNSSFYTADIDSADIVFVDMHCYYQVQCQPLCRTPAANLLLNVKASSGDVYFCRSGGLAPQMACIGGTRRMKNSRYLTSSVYSPSLPPRRGSRYVCGFT